MLFCFNQFLGFSHQFTFALSLVTNLQLIAVLQTHPQIILILYKGPQPGFIMLINTHTFEPLFFGSINTMTSILAI